MTKVVNELYNVAEKEGIYKKGDERQDQESQGESLIHAGEKYVEMGDDQINPAGSMKLAANAMRGGYPEEEALTKMGIPMEEEPIDMEGI